MFRACLAILAIAACSKTDHARAWRKSVESVSVDAALPARAPAQLAGWDMVGRAKAWQGAHVLEASPGFAIAFEVTGASAHTWDGKLERQLDFALESPCSAKLIEKTSAAPAITHFTVAGGKLMAGLGDAGSRSGDSAIACIGNQIFTLDDAGTCLTWASQLDVWHSAPASCGFATRDGKDVFVAKVDGADTTLEVDGDALLSPQLAYGASLDFPSYIVARSVRDTK